MSICCAYCQKSGGGREERIEIARDAPHGFFRAPAEHSKQCQGKRKTAPMPNSSAIS